MNRRGFLFLSFFFLAKGLLAQPEELDSLFYALVKQTIGSSDNISVKPKVRTPSTLWDAEWDRVKIAPYFRQEDAAFVKEQIQRPAFKKWNKARLKKIKAAPRKAIDSDEFVALYEVDGRVSFSIDLPISSADGNTVVIFYRVRGSKLNALGEHVIVWARENKTWTVEKSGLISL